MAGASRTSLGKGGFREAGEGGVEIHLVHDLIARRTGLDQARPEGAIHLTLYWHNRSVLPESYVVFAHLTDRQGNLVGQIDETPLQKQWPTDRWPSGSRLADRHALPLDPHLPPGDYTLSVGLYNPRDLARLPAQSDQKQVTDNALILSQVSICLDCAAQE